MPRPSRIAAGVLGLVYLVFLFWWGGSGTPLTDAEKVDYLERLDAIGAQSSHRDPKILPAFRTLVTQDDGNEYYMINLMKYREKALYPPGYDYDDDVQAAAARYNAAVLPGLLRQGSFVVLLGHVQGRFLDFEGADEWDDVGIVRYRSRRDMLEFALYLGAQDQAIHKFASLEKTHVFPAEPVISLAMVRTLMATLLAVVWLGLHGLFSLLGRRRAGA